MSRAALRDEIAKLYRAGAIMTADQRKEWARAQGQAWREAQLKRRAECLEEGHADLLTREQLRKEAE